MNKTRFLFRFVILGRITKFKLLDIEREKNIIQTSKKPNIPIYNKESKMYLVFTETISGLGFRRSSSMRLVIIVGFVILLFLM